MSIRRREDYGFFGPGSPTWRVWTDPSAFIGFQRAVTIETLDPFLAAAVNKMRGVYTNPRRRFDRTAQYFLTIAVGDSRSAIEASRVLHRVHAGVGGTEPVTGRTFSANDPERQLWIHLTAWHSMLLCYERFGPGRLSAADEERYWQECAIAAQLQPIEPGSVPTSREGVRRYFEDVRPRCALTAEGRSLFLYFLRPRMRRDALLLTAVWRASTAATLSTLPRWMRDVAGLRQGPLGRAVGTFGARAWITALRPMPARLFAVARLAPSARVLLETAARGEEPVRPVVVTPHEAMATFGEPFPGAAGGTESSTPATATAAAP